MPASNPAIQLEHISRHYSMGGAASCVPPSAAFFVRQRPQRRADRQAAHFSRWHGAQFAALASARRRLRQSARSLLLGSEQSHCHGPNLAGLKIYFDCGDEDDFGFDPGANALDKVLTSRHVPHEFHIYPGRHDATYFAAHLPASLVFHSRLFPK